MAEGLERNEARRALTDWMIQQACRVPVSFRDLAMSSPSRCAVAAASGINSLQRRAVLLKVASAIGLTGIVEV